MTQPAWMPVAESYIGTKEIAGSKHNPVILGFFEAVNNGYVKNDETAWCAAFVNWCCKKKGYQYTGKLNARSWLG